MPDAQRSDSDLIRDAQMGDVGAFEGLYDRYLPTVWRYVYRRVGGDWSAAEDVVAETFLAAVRDVAHLDADSCIIGAWLTGIARHKVGDHFRRLYRRREVAAPDAVEGMVGSEGARPEASAEVSELQATVSEAMDRLSDEQRLALEWKVVDRLSVREIGERLDRSEKSVESILYRARKLLRGILGARFGGGG